MASFLDKVKQLSGKTGKPMIRIIVSGQYASKWSEPLFDEQGVIEPGMAEEIIQTAGNCVFVPDENDGEEDPDDEYE